MSETEQVPHRYIGSRCGTAGQHGAHRWRKDVEHDLPICWSAWYHPEWDQTPEAYLEAQLVKPTRSRRLGRYSDPLHERKGYIGVYHQAGHLGTEGRIRFFLSLFVQGHPLGLRSAGTIDELLVVLAAVHGQDNPWEAFP